MDRVYRMLKESRQMSATSGAVKAAADDNEDIDRTEAPHGLTVDEKLFLHVVDRHNIITACYSPLFLAKIACTIHVVQDKKLFLHAVERGDTESMRRYVELVRTSTAPIKGFNINCVDSLGRLIYRSLFIRNGSNCNIHT